MGIKDLLKLIDGAISKTSLDEIRDYTMAIDIDCVIYTYQSVGSYYDIVGIEQPNTNYLNGLSNDIQLYKRFNIEPIYVFGDHDGRKEKENENLRRQRLKNSAQAKLNDLVSIENKTSNIISKMNSLKKQTFRITEKIIDECIELFDKNDVRWIRSPPGIDAEQYCCYLCNTTFEADCVFSNDTDCLPFGAPTWVRYFRRSWYVINLDDVLDYLEIDYDTFVRMCVVLGCDYAKKTWGSSIKNIYNYLDRPLSDEQIRAIEIFKERSF